MSIVSALSKIKESIPNTVTLVAVSKTKPNELILEAYQAGQRVFGENKVQELVQKNETLAKDIEWHMIGHLQRNKVKYIAPFVSLIHGVDSAKLLKEINKQGNKHGRVVPVLLQIHIAQEETKFGFSKEEITAFLNSASFVEMKNIEVHGLMGMATNSSNKKLVAAEFAHLKSLFDELKSSVFSSSPDFKEISMGMSGDYDIAIEQGSTMIRVGSSIFGKRN